MDFALDELPGDSLHQALHAYRAQGPVVPARFLGLDAFVITGHAALKQAFLDVERFPPHRMYQASFEPAIGKSFISLPDPAQHRVYRKLATPAFRHRAVERIEENGLRALAHELVDRLEGTREFDLVERFTARFPYLVISRLLGLPREREDDFHGWALPLLRFQDDPAAAARASEQFTNFLAPIVADRRSEPRDDVISELIGAEAEGRALSDEEIYAHVRLLLPTGGETTHGSLGNLLYALLHAGEGWARIAAQPELAAAAADEVLRWESPIAVLPRMSASEACEFQGVELPPDSWVLFAIAGANRDPEVFADADRFDPQRSETDTLTFGKGVKSCPGMHLARRNMIVALEVLVERFPQLELLDRDAALPRRSVLRSPDALRVRRSGA